MTNSENETSEMIGGVAKGKVLGFIVKNPYVLIIVLIGIGLIIWFVFKKGKADETIKVPEVKIEDVDTNPNLGKTPAERIAFNQKAITYAKRVYDATNGVDFGIYTQNTKDKAILFGEMLKLNQTQMTLVNDKWIDKWFTKKSESMYAAIKDDIHWYNLSTTNAPALLKLLTQYELNDT